MLSVNQSAAVVIAVFSCFCLFQGCSGCNGTGTNGFISAERRLLSCLMSSDYNKAVRPALNPNDTVSVTFDTLMGSLIDLDEKTGVLTTEVWMFQQWTDPQLKWNPEEFDGLKEIRIPIDSIWTPNIVLHNNAEDTFRYIVGNLAKVTYNGVVTWIPHGRLRSWCELDMSDFPFDEQNCHIIFGSWSYDISRVELRLAGKAGSAQREFLEKSTEWDIDSYDSIIHNILIKDPDRLNDEKHDFKTYGLVFFSFQMRRTSLFYKYMLVGPSVILAIITLALYWIPIQSGERFMLASGVLVSTTLLFVILEGYLPTDMSRLPVVASYMCYNLVLLLVTIVVSIIVYNCYHRDMKNSTVPRLVRKVFLGAVSKMCCVTTRPYTSLAGEEHVASRQAAHKELSDNEPVDSASHVSNTTTATTLERTLDDIRRYLRVLATKPDNIVDQEQQQPTHRELVVNEWQKLALVIDRLTFGFLLLVSIILTLALYGR